jgi:hypothetical protein
MSVPGCMRMSKRRSSTNDTSDDQVVGVHDYGQTPDG